MEVHVCYGECPLREAILYPLTQFSKVWKCFLSSSMIDHVPLGEKSEGVKLFINGISWLMDGHDNDPLTVP